MSPLDGLGNGILVLNEHREKYDGCLTTSCNTIRCYWPLNGVLGPLAGGGGERESLARFQFQGKYTNTVVESTNR